MKKIIKKTAAQLSYLLYRGGIKKCDIKVSSIEETIEELIHTEKSLVRLGDGEITMIRGRDLSFQKNCPEIAEGLKRILAYKHEDLITAIPDIFGDLCGYRKESRDFWKDHLLFSRKVYAAYYNPGRTYANAYISRFYYPMEDKSQCKKWMEGIKQIWKGKDVVIVEGERTHNGVGNDLFDTAGSIERIIGPSEQAFEKTDEILEYCKEYPKDRLFLISLGIAAKFLTEKLFLEGYRVIDIGNLDMEYEWYLHRAGNKEKIPKHDVIGEEANRDAGYHEYLAQIKMRILN